MLVGFWLSVVGYFLLIVWCGKVVSDVKCSIDVDTRVLCVITCFLHLLICVWLVMIGVLLIVFLLTLRDHGALCLIVIRLLFLSYILSLSCLADCL